MARGLLTIGMEVMAMVLKLDTEQLELMRTALLEYSKSLRAQARPHCAGYSPVGIELCVKRMQVEALMDALDTSHQANAA